MIPEFLAYGKAILLKRKEIVFFMLNPVWVSNYIKYKLSFYFIVNYEEITIFNNIY